MKNIFMIVLCSIVFGGCIVIYKEDHYHTKGEVVVSSSKCEMVRLMAKEGEK